MLNLLVRFEVCVWAALIVTLLEFAGIGAASEYVTQRPVKSQTSTQGQLIGASDDGASR